MHMGQPGEDVLECGRRRMTWVVCESGNFAVWKRAVPRNRMREIFTYGSVGGLVGQIFPLPFSRIPLKIEGLS